MEDENYIMLSHKPILTPTLVMAILGTISIVIGLTGSIGLIEIPGPAIGVALIVGSPFCFAWLPALYRSGVELDSINNRFREYSGNLGNEKGDWISVSDGSYLSIVGINEKRTSTGRSAVLTFNVRACKVYFHQDDWHIEVYKASYSSAQEFAEEFAEAFRLEINDVNHEQITKTGNQDPS